jgi:hypothetical protein
MSVPKQQLLKVFNDHFIEFIEDIIRVFPIDQDLTTVKNYFLLIRKTNPKLIITVFHEHVYLKYDKQIQNNNIQFFIDKDYKDDLTENKHSDKIIESINRLRNPIRLMNEEDKMKTVKYLQNLCKLSNSYICV